MNKELHYRIYQVKIFNQIIYHFSNILCLTGLQSGSLRRLPESKNSVPDDTFLDQLVRCQSSRLEDQRSPLPAPLVDVESEAPINQNDKSGSTVPDEDFFSLIMRVQSGRMDDQRASIPHNQRY